MQKIDLRKELKHLYAPSAKQVQVVDVPEFQFAMIDGVIEPGATPDTSPSFQNAMQALYGISYTLKFMCKQRAPDPVDYKVMAMEGLWWVADGQFSFERKDNWCWRLLILQPDFITDEMYQQSLAQLRKKQPDNPALDLMRLERFQEGLAVQVMHVGPYSEEPATIEQLHAFARENGYRLRGKHHEIYLGDPRRSAPEKLKTILRHPVERPPDVA